MGRLLVKTGVIFGAELAPAGARILETLKHISKLVEFDVVITSARDGVHSGPADPHHTGEAFDLRTNTLKPEEKAQLLTLLRASLYAGMPRRFYAFLESPGLPGEHVHVQRRAGTTYTIYDFLSNS